MADGHQPPQVPISPAIEQFIADHGQAVGMEAWASYSETPDGLRPWKLWNGLPNETKDKFAQVARDVLEDFAVWYDSGHFTGSKP